MLARETRIYKRRNYIYYYSTAKLLSSDIINTQLKLAFYEQIGLRQIIVEKPKNLIQSLAVSYARYMFYQENNIAIDGELYRRLFVGKKYFESTYEVDTQNLIKKYPYSIGNI